MLFLYVMCVSNYTLCFIGSCLFKLILAANLEIKIESIFMLMLSSRRVIAVFKTSIEVLVFLAFTRITRNFGRIS